jgi:hypothetical protein
MSYFTHSIAMLITVEAAPLNVASFGDWLSSFNESEIPRDFEEPCRMRGEFPISIPNSSSFMDSSESFVAVSSELILSDELSSSKQSIDVQVAPDYWTDQPEAGSN